MVSKMIKDTELRKLPAGCLSFIEEILEINEDWKRFMSHIPKNLENLFNDEHYELKYNGEHIRLIENHAKETKVKCAKVLFVEWGTSGRVRPTLKTLQTLLVRTEMFKAADLIANMLGEPLPQRPSYGPAAPVDVNVTDLLNDECTTRQLITSNNCNHATEVVKNISDKKDHPSSDLGQQPAKAMCASDMIKFTRNASDSQHQSTSELGQQPAKEMSASDMIKFSKNTLDSQHLTEFSKNASDNQHLPASGLGLQPAKALCASDMINFSKNTLDGQHLPEFSQNVSNNPHDASGLSLQPSKPMSAHDMIEFSKHKLDGQHLPELLKNVSDSRFLPDFNILDPKTINTNSMSLTGDSETQSHSHSTQSSRLQSKSFQSSNFLEQIDKDILKNTNLIQFAFNDLEAITNNFSDTLGSGGFGDVFLGRHDGLGLLAVKKAHNQHTQSSKELLDMVTMFNTEVNSLSLLHHENIVPIIGYSKDGPAPCIVCEYIDGGTLKQKIADKVLNESQRINIMIGTAEGLKYIHNTVKPNPNPLHSGRNAYFIHRDVKSANIMLTKDYLPKLCDFGLAKQIEKTHNTEIIRGTGAYMAPESLSGTITHKSDVYGFGIVLLELLTGLQPIVCENNEQMNIKDYLEENSVDNDISKFFDKVVDRWVKAQSIYDIAQRCLTLDRDQRPSMDVVSKDLHNIQNNN